MAKHTSLSNGGIITYLNVLGDKFAQEVKPETQGAQEITNSKGVKKYYLLYQGITGVIVDLSTKESDFTGKMETYLVVKLRDGSETMQLEFRVGSGMFKSFANRIINADVSKPVTLTVAVFEEEKGGKAITNKYVLVYNGETKVLPKYSKDELPACEAITHPKTQAFIEWDKTEQNTFFLDKLNELKSKLTPTEAAAITSAPVDHEEFSGDNENDLPF